MKKINLSKQLIFIIVSVFIVIYIMLAILIPSLLTPIYENNIYHILKQPLDLVETDTINLSTTEIAYIYIYSNNTIRYSTNLEDVTTLKPEDIINYIESSSGKFKYLNKTYYYNTVKVNNGIKIALTNDNYTHQFKKEILYTILPILGLTFFITLGLVLLWSRMLIQKIEHLKQKIDNLDNPKYKNDSKYRIEDELSELSNAIDEVKIAINEQEEYKNQMYQSISHDLKTPITVIKSYVEGIEDGVQTEAEGINVIKEQINKLELKVHSLLYLNKLNYLETQEQIKNEKVNIEEIINSSVKKFNVQKPNLEFITEIDKKEYDGTVDLWEAIIDNLLANFIRYAESQIKITTKNNKIIFYNDGPNIDENILNDIFTPYKKGIKGQFGLGLSIVKKAVVLLGYEITVHNEKKGVSFIIRR